MQSFAAVFKEDDPLVRVQLMIKSGSFEKMANDLKPVEPQYKQILADVKPDMIIIDNLFTSPALINSGIPYMTLWSAGPLMIYNNDKVPPNGMGLPADDRSNWEKYRKAGREAMDIVTKTWVDFMKEQGSTNLPPRGRLPWVDSPYANIHMFPKELDYEDLCPKPAKWHRFDHFLRSTDETFEVPEKLKNLPGKLIYFSLGSLGTMVTEVVQKWLDVLAKLPHRFIVSGGPGVDQLKLAPNIWASKFLPQPAVLQLVDLVITHGGNNSLTETMFYGKPMITVPLFGDQPDNAQRVHEKGFGIKMHAWNVEEKELSEAVEKLLADEKLKKRLQEVSKRIQNANNQLEAAKLIERVIIENPVK